MLMLREHKIHIFELTGNVLSIDYKIIDKLTGKGVGNEVINVLAIEEIESTPL